MIEEELNKNSYYTRIDKSMLNYEYKSVFFVYQKPESAARDRAELAEEDGESVLYNGPQHSEDEEEENEHHAHNLEPYEEDGDDDDENDEEE